MSKEISKTEVTTSASIPIDVNVHWHDKLKKKIKGSGLSIYDNGWTEIPEEKDWAEKLEHLFQLRDSILEAKKTHPQVVEELGKLEKVSEEISEDALVEEGFSFEEAYSTIKGILEEIKKGPEKEVIEAKDYSKTWSHLGGEGRCSYCGFPIGRYPLIELQRCVSCGALLKLPVVDSIQPESLIQGRGGDGELVTPMIHPDLGEHLEKIRQECKNRDYLYKNLKMMVEGKADRHTALKAACSCLTRVTIEDEHNPEKGILEAVGAPLLQDIQSLLQGQFIEGIQTRIGQYFLLDKKITENYNPHPPKGSERLLHLRKMKKKVKNNIRTLEEMEAGLLDVFTQFQDLSEKGKSMEPNRKKVKVGIDSAHKSVQLASSSLKDAVKIKKGWE